MKTYSLLFLFALMLAQKPYANMIDSGVVVEDLPSFSLNSLGTTTVFSSDIWQTSEEGVLFDLIDSIGTQKLTPASKRALTLLLTQDSTGYKGSNNQTDLFLLKRLNALQRMGSFNEALNLINQIPQKNLSEDIIKIKINLLLALGNLEEATKLTDDYSLGSYADKTRINIFLEKEEKNKAILSYEIYRENSENPVNDPFYKLADTVLLELDNPLEKETAILPEHTFLFARLKEKISDYPHLTDGIKKVLINLPATPIETRIQFAEQLNLTAEEFSKIYNLPLLNLKIDKNHLKRTDIYQKIINSQNPDEQAKLLKNFIDLSKQDKIFLNVAPIILTHLNALIAQPAYIDLAFDAVQIYILNNNLEKANEWYQLLSKSPADNNQKQRLFLIPGLQLLGYGLPKETDSLIAHFCPNPNESDCSSFWKKMPSVFFEEITAPKPLAQTIIPFEYVKEENAPKKGENLIRAILDLNNPNISDKKTILSFINTTAPQIITRELKQEDVIYQ